MIPKLTRNLRAKAAVSRAAAKARKASWLAPVYAFLRAHEPFLLCFAGAIGLYTILYVMLAQSFWAPGGIEHYLAQTQAWLEGKMYLDYPMGDEVAFYRGRYYVSFPPVPSVFLLPLVPFFTGPVPTNAVVTLYGLLALVVGYAFARRAKASSWEASFLALFAVLGSNFLFMSTHGGPWFQAQTLGFLLVLTAFYTATFQRTASTFLALTSLGLAVGCRPFHLFLLPALLLVVWKPRRNESNLAAAVRLSPLALGMLTVFAGLGAYNYARFGNPLEFGHNLLPEFQRAVDGQFSWRYLWPNLIQMFRWPWVVADGAPHLHQFNGFAFYIANPFLGVFLWRMWLRFRKQITAVDLALVGGILLEAVGILCHKTLGGWQFGNRYTVDFIPAAFFFVLRQKASLSSAEKVIAVLAIVWNACGTLWLFGKA